MKSIPKMFFAMVLLLGLLVPLSGGAAEKKELVIGMVMSTTGRLSTSGEYCSRGAELWVEHVNARGGIFVKNIGKKLPVKLLVYDDQSDASTCAKMYERLITVDKVDLLLPPFGSGNTFAATVITEKHRFPMVLGSAATEKIYERGFNYIFQGDSLTKAMADIQVDYLSTIKHEIKKVVVLYENFLLTLSMANYVKQGLREKGLNLSMYEMYPLGCTDFSSILVKVKAVNPDALLNLNISVPVGIYATRQMHELGIEPKFYLVGMGPMYTKEFIEGLGELSERVAELGVWHWDFPYKGGKEFYEDYLRRFGRTPNSESTHLYKAGEVLEQAVLKAGTLDKEALNKTLHSEEFSTIEGPVKYEKNGVNMYQQTILCQIQDGKRVLVWPPKLAKGTMRLPYRK